MSNENIFQPPPDRPLYFIRRRRDGKYLRGARLHPWCRNWRDAAAISKYVYEFVDAELKTEEVEFLTLDEVVARDHYYGGVRDSVRGFVLAVASLVGF